MTEVRDQLSAEYFDVMATFAERHWWYVSRRKLAVHAIASSHDRRRAGRALDIGCGTGEMLAELRDLGFGVVGSDLSDDALARARRIAPVLQSVAESLPYPDETVDCIASMDVVEHLDDDVVALREYHRVLRPGGTLLLTVPAYQWLWSAHDDWACHRRRYTARQLRASVTAAGLTVERSTYYNSFLLPPAILLRRTPLKRFVKGTAEEVSYVRPSVNRMFGLLAAAERAVARRVGIPFGLSILLLARRAT
jgi:SAM-dependent methyltransferase